MSGQILYMKCDANVEVNREDVFLKDVASLQCADVHILAKCRAVKVWHFAVKGAGAVDKDGKSGKRQKSNVQKRVVVSALKLVSLVDRKSVV